MKIINGLNSASYKLFTLQIHRLRSRGRTMQMHGGRRPGRLPAPRHEGRQEVEPVAGRRRGRRRRRRRRPVPAEELRPPTGRLGRVGGGRRDTAEAERHPPVSQGHRKRGPRGRLWRRGSRRRPGAPQGVQLRQLPRGQDGEGQDGGLQDGGGLLAEAGRLDASVSV